MRLVLDTNVVLSALLWRGTPYRLLTASHASSTVQLFSSRALLAELADVLTRASLSHRFTQLGKSANEVLDDYVAVIALADPRSVPRVVPTDSDDDQVVACALAAQADLIVSGDRDLLDLKQYRGMPIVTPAAALQRLTA